MKGHLATRPRQLSPNWAATLLLTMLFWALLGGTAAAQGNDFGTALKGGLVSALGLSFVGGLLVSLTPCVYPMIAITVSIFGARQAKSRAEGIGLSSAFVAGIMCMFTPLGVAAGLSGSLFGAALQHPAVLTFVAVLFLLMSASLFGAFDMALPSSLTTKLSEVGGLGPKGAFGLGLVCGLIAAPCTGPVLTGILTYIAQTQDSVLGGLAMATFSLGLGIPFFLVGAFAMQLPKGGHWMVSIKSFLAIVLSIVALSYLGSAYPVLERSIPRPAWLPWVLLVAILLGIGLGAVHKDFSSPRIEDRLMKSIGAAMSTAAGFALLVFLSAPSSTLQWKHEPLSLAQERARAEGVPLLVDFTAAWCGACKELDKVTFADPAVSREARRFSAIKVDATNEETEGVQAAMKDLRVVGLPTVVLLDSQGHEKARFNNFVSPGEFLKALKSVH